MQRRSERVAITGIGVISALGGSASDTFERLCAGERGIRALSLFDPQGLACRIAGEVTCALPALHGAGRTAALAFTAAEQALSAAHVEPRVQRVGLVLGETTGGMLETETEIGAAPGTADALRARRLITHPLSHSARVLEDALGPFVAEKTVCSACSSGAVALAIGAQWIASGRADAVLAGGADALCRMTFAGFSALGVVDAEPCRPFDVARAGLNLGEGAAFLVLESESSAERRGARVLAWLSGWAIGAEAFHVTHPEPSGARAAGLIEQALSRAALRPADVDYVNAHGTGTAANDSMEAEALKRVFTGDLERVRVSSSKAQLGHTLGAAGAIEAAISVLCLEQGAAPPNAGLETPAAPELHYVRERAERLPLRAVASNSFGFGGMDAVLVFTHRDRAQEAPAQPVARIVVSRLACSGAHELSGRDCARLTEQTPEPAPSPRDPLAALDPERSRRFDRTTAFAACAGALALAGDVDPAIGLVLGGAYGPTERSLRFIDRLFAKGLRYAAPAEFPHLVHSAAAGNTSLYLGLTGPTFAVAEAETCGEAAFAAAHALVESGACARILAGAAEAYDAVAAELIPQLRPELPRPRSEAVALLELESLENARASGRTALAEVVSCEEWRSAFSTRWAALAPPLDGVRAEVVSALGDASFEREFAASAWGRVRRTRLVEHAGFSEALGAVALAVGAGRVAAGAREVLVVSATPRVHYVTRLRAVEEP